MLDDCRLGESHQYSAEVVGRAEQCLVGRGREVRCLLDVLAAAVESGKGACASVSGPAGIGKSALLSAIGEQAVGLGFAARSVEADRLSQRRPLSVVSELLDRPVPPMSSDAGSSSHISPHGFEMTPLGHAETAEALQVVEHLAQEPLLLVVDDAQWADRWSLLVLQRIARMSADQPMVLLLGTRDLTDLDRPEVSDIFVSGSPGSVTRIELGPLSLPPVLELARQTLGGEPGPGLRELLSGAGGNPLLITELLRGLSVIEDAQSGRVDVQTDALPAQITDAIALRLSALSRDRRVLLERAAVLGMSFSGEDLAAISGCSVLEIAPDLLALCRAGLLLDRGHDYSFAHDLTHEVVYAQNSPSIRRALHRDVARVLGEHDASAHLVLYHLAAGAEAGDEDVVHRLLDASHDLAATDPPMALSLLDRAAEIAVSAEACRQVEHARGVPLAWAGQLDEASALLLQAVEVEPEAEVRAVLRWTLAGVLLLANRAGEAVEEVRGAASETTEPVTLARLAAEQALAELAIADPAASTTANRALDLAAACGDTTSAVAAHSVLARLLATAHRYRTGLTHTAQAVELAEGDPTGEAQRFTPWFYHGVMLLDVEDGAGVAEAIRMGRQRVREIGNHWADAFYCGLAASLALREGRLDESSAEALAGIALGVDAGALTTVGWCHAIEAHVALHRGDSEGAATHVDHARRHLEAGEAPFGIDFMVRAEALLHEARGDADIALTTLKDAWHGFAAFGIENCQPLLAPDLVRLAAAAGDGSTVAEVLELMAHIAEMPDAPSSFAAISDRCRGLAHHDTALLERARQGYPSGRVMDRALTGLELAECLAASGHSDEASVWGGPLLEEFDSMEAASLSARLTASVPGLNEAAPSGEGDASPWDSLTGAERAVADLVARGATNAEIARERGTSIRTVETQLYRAYFKLGISSRTKLAVEAARALPDAS